MSGQVWRAPAPDAVPAPVPPPIRDVHSYANVNELKPESLHLDWTIDWSNKRILGSVLHRLQALTEVSRAIFDTSFLAIESVSVDGHEAKFELGERRGPLGEPLYIDIGQRKAGDHVQVKINYATTNKCTALGWLSKEQTHTKKTPFLYSQCQAIHGRSMLPCMDSPSRKVTYTASVTSTIPVLMSALQEQAPQDAEDGAKVYTFRQPVAIPTYLLAIVGGLLEFRSLGPRTGVWAEPTDADKVQWEFEADAERFLTEAEKLVSPYSWTRYDSVVLPPSFPYGGMENANLTTLTPSLVCGDRSSTDVLLHELCHSWSGNLISCVNWESFWLNEGWTVYLERLLLQMVHADDNGPGHRGFSYIIGNKAMRDSLEGFADTPRFQRLIPLYRDGEDPDDAFSSIPYDKGANFLLYLERQVGGLDNFVPYIKAYFHTFAGRSVSTEEWREHLFAFYAGNEKATKALHEVDWDAWLHGEGVELPVAMHYDESLAVEAFALADRWIHAIHSGDTAKFDKMDMDGWNASQVVVFLEKLHAGPRVPAAMAQRLDEVYGLSTAANTEIRLRFYEVALEDKQGVYAKDAAEWVCMCHLCQVKTQGRMKYCRTIFKALHKVEPALAKQTFLANESFYHPIAAAMIRKDILAHKAPHVVAVIGSTGTGKSQLAVELAEYASVRGLPAEAISADSMQTYCGLDVITNKASAAEMQNVPHHLMSFLPPGSEYDITKFVRDATRLCEGMQKRGTLPILVGGTTYYVQHFLFPGQLVSQAAPPLSALSPAMQARIEALPPDLHALWSEVIAVPTSEDLSLASNASQLWSLLHALDPASAQRWHYNDFRKVYRSLRILYESGKPQSAWLDAQDARDRERQRQDPRRRLLFWVWSARDVLQARLDARIGKMIERGLLEEIQTLRAMAREQSPTTDYTRGIFQAIGTWLLLMTGYKEFDAYLTHRDQGSTHEEAQDLFDQAITSMQTATRRYAKRQTSWIRNQLVPEIQKARAAGEEVWLYLLDATDVSQWATQVREPAQRLLQTFLDGGSMPDPTQLSPAAAEQLQVEAKEGGRLERNRLVQCDVCTHNPSQPFLFRENERYKHEQSRTHRYAFKRRTRDAYIAACKASGEAVRQERQAPSSTTESEKE